MRNMAVTQRPSTPILSLLLAWLAFVVSPVLGACECGYTATVKTAQPSTYVFTDIIESDFFHINDVTKDTDWVRQRFNQTPEAGRGPHGINYTLGQTFSNPIPDHANWTGPGKFGGDPGMRLEVEGGIPADNYVKTSQIVSNRTDLIWGSYRASIKLSPVAGTCAAFFWYFNNSQEIDMEFLSSQFNADNGSFPVNLVLQSEKSAKNGFNAAGTDSYVVANLPFNPTTGFHEYRFDYVPGHILFYADGTVLANFNTSSSTPFEPGHLILTHWSNGNPLWSAGPPVSNATMSVGYVKSYFNSSSPDRQSSYTKRCKDPAAAGAICPIPEQNSLPDPSVAVGNTTAANTFFFSDDPSQSANQVVYKKSAGSRVASTNSLLMSTFMLMGLSFGGLLIF
ncbi:hypothetical protein HYALB_00008766 [Hymenoscyphus albidus]|uniref:GH16 domain-containing protein n=1 Tax=Hymenoscyphus albidus TaxID=595503 RepID=A0A9N9LDF3_9HELO|nr:hypothetical protein HYALB_00008766 [Hymenoscyphus albidus]